MLDVPSLAHPGVGCRLLWSVKGVRLFEIILTTDTMYFDLTFRTRFDFIPVDV